LGQITVASLQAIMRDHASYPDSICNHENMGHEPHDRSRTLLSMIMDLTGMVIWVAPGPPCCGEYVAHRLDVPAKYSASLAVEDLLAAGDAI